MDVSSFAPNAPGELIPIEKGQHAFIPSPLTSGFQVDPKLVRLLGQANNALGALCAAGKQLPNPDLFVAPLRKQEAVLSSRIEGSEVTLDDAFAEDVSSKESQDDSHREIRNYEQALHIGIEHLQRGRKINVDLIKRMHVKLLDSVRGQLEKPGVIKETQNFIGRSDYLEEARFIPPPPLPTVVCLEHLEAYYANEDEIDDPLIRCALAHYQFETIHPFRDGNGRIGRALIPLQLISEGAIDRPWLFLSPYFETRRDEYYDRLLAVSKRAEWSEWLRFFVTGVRDVASTTTGKIQKLQALCQDYEARVRKASNSTNPIEILQLLKIFPFLTVDIAQQRLDVHRNTAAHAIQALEKLDILKRVGALPTKGRGRPPDVYCAPELFKIIKD